jgi:hypothetical protein
MYFDRRPQAPTREAAAAAIEVASIIALDALPDDDPHDLSIGAQMKQIAIYLPRVIICTQLGIF